MLPDNKEKEPFIQQTKNKRDEYIVSIRKQKNKAIILSKRMKYFTNEQLTLNQDMRDEDSLQAHGKSKIQNQTPQISQDTKNDLKNACEQLYKALYARDWEQSEVILREIRDQVGSEQGKIPACYVIEEGIVPDIVTLLSDEYEKCRKLQAEAAWLIANLSAGMPSDVKYLYDLNIIPVLFETLKTKNEELHENSMWALSNIAGEEDFSYRNEMINLGVIKRVSRQLCTTPKRILYLRTAAWLISNLVRGPPYPDYDQTSCTLANLTDLIDQEDKLTQEYTLMALCFISECSDSAKLVTISAYGFIPKIIKYILSEDENIAKYALRCAGNLSLGSIKITRQLSENEIFQALPYVLDHDNKSLRKEACYTLSNILADEFDDHDYVLENNIIPILIRRIEQDDYEIRVDATYCITNFAYNCTLDEIQKLTDKRILDSIIANLDIENKKLIISSLKAIGYILKHGESLKKNNPENINPFVLMILNSGNAKYIEKLQQHNDQEIYDLVSELIERFFPNTEVNDIGQ